MHWKLWALALGWALLSGCAATPLEVKTESLGSQHPSEGLKLECPFGLAAVRDGRTARGFSDGARGVVLFDDLPVQLDQRLSGVRARPAETQSSPTLPTADLEIRSAYSESVGSRVFANIVVAVRFGQEPARFVRGRHTASSFFGGRCDVSQCVHLAIDDLLVKLEVLLVDEFDCRPLT